ncbi:MAG TPA: tachylectin-related carbohydrate-binding protein [Thermoanaerobaculia bacterium]|jgi:hypothetical protein|nr:tachylectin-related carbohydrate-binding protein [Thermoanaerobaculia bacterium]
MKRAHLAALGRPVATIAVALTALLSSPPLRAQTVTVNTPGNLFIVDRGHATLTDVPGGRRVRSHADETVILKALLRMPAPTAGAPKVRRLVVRFRTSDDGPSLRSVELRNGSTPALRVATNIRGNYMTRETTKPDFLANTWDLTTSERAVSSQTVILLEIHFPTGYEGLKDAGEFVLNAVSVGFPAISHAGPAATERLPAPVLVPNLKPASTNGVIYAINANNDLLWYRHTGREDGAFRWAPSSGKKVGSGWAVKQAFCGGSGVIYAVMSNGDLRWNRHDGRVDGTDRWAAPNGNVVGTGWNFAHVFSAGGGVIYAITDGGDLFWYHHAGFADGTATWASEPKKVGSGWNFKHVFADGTGVIYAVNDGGDLLWYRHDGWRDGSDRWANPQGAKVGSGWNVRQVFSGGDGVIYAVTSNGEVLWNRHDGRTDGTFRWAAPQGRKVGSGWMFTSVF